MKGRRSVWVRTGQLETKRPRRRFGETPWNLDALSDEELEALMPLSEKQAQEPNPVWTADEQALLARLWAKAATSEETRRCG